jgi:Flp pilus assembly protein TadD
LSLLISVDPMQAPVTQLELADRCIALDPHYADCWQTRGMALRRMRRHAEAIAAFERCLEVSAAAHDCLRDLAISHVTTGECEKFEGDAKNLIVRLPSSRSATSTGRGADARGRPLAAVRSAAEAGADPEAGGGAGVEGLEDELAVALATGRFSEAEDLARKLAKKRDAEAAEGLTRGRRGADLGARGDGAAEGGGKVAQATLQGWMCGRSRWTRRCCSTRRCCCST